MEKEKITNEILELTQSLMKCETTKDNFSEFDKAFKILEDYFEGTGFFIKRLMVNDYPNYVISNVDDNDFDIIFCGHMDVVPNDEYVPKVENGNLYGRGSFDMKGGVCTMATLLKNNPTDKKVALLITSDEEIGGMCCKEILKDYNSKLAVIPDGGADFNLIVEEKGLLQIEITTKGVKAHASQPWNGENAILKSINIYNKLLEIYKLPECEEEFITSVNLSKLEGGSTINAVADVAKMTLDIRFSKEDNKESILENIKKIAPDSEVKILDWGPVFFVDDNLEIMKDFKEKAKQVLGHEMQVKKFVATSDAIYFSEKNIPTILTNPKGDYAHHPKEYVEIDSLYTLYELFKTLV